MSFNNKAIRNAQFRDELIEMVLDGQLTPIEAERMASEKNAGPLTGEPNRSHFNVRELTTWSIEMAIAWILWRNYDSVLDFYNPFLEKCTRFRQISKRVGPSPFERKSADEPKKIRYEIATGLPATWRSFSAAVQLSKPTFVEGSEPHKKAKRMLFERLYAGELEASALRFDNDEFRNIPANEWSHLEMSDTSGCLTRDDLDFSGRPVYKRVKLSREHLETLWSIPPAENDDTKIEPVEIDAIKRPSSKQVKKAIAGAARFFTEKGLLMWTKDEAEAELKRLLGATRNQCRSIFAEEDMKQHFQNIQGPRGPINTNRNTELESFRHFFQSANMRK